MKRIVIAVISILLLLVPTAAAFRSNRFVTPSRNIRCTFGAAGPSVFCMRMNDQRIVYVNVSDWQSGRIARDPRQVEDYRFRNPVLAYGRQYVGTGFNKRNTIVCTSRITGLTCVGYSGNAVSRPAFFISRTRIRIFRAR
jgi:hypothetical protein